MHDDKTTKPFEIQVTLQVQALTEQSAMAYVTLFLDGEMDWDDSGIICWEFKG